MHSFSLIKTMDLKATAGEKEMNLLFPFLILIIPLLFLIFKHIISQKQHPQLPPGPYPLPLIGNIFQMAGKKLHVTLTNLAQVHGPLMSLKLGTQRLIIGSSPAAAMEILKTHDRILSGRYIPHAHPAKSLKFNNLSLAFANECNDQWNYLRAVCRTELFSTKALDGQVKRREKKVMEMVRFLGGKEGRVVNIGEIAFAVVFNILSNTFFSVDFIDFEGKGVGGEMKELTRKFVDLLSIPNVSEFYPILSGLDVQGIGKKTLCIIKRICTIWEDIIRERRQQTSTNVSGHERDFLDALLEIGFRDDQINQLIQELLSAGTETSSSIIEWAMAELLKNQEAMHKLGDELAHKIGKEDMVKESDLPNLPYLQACVKEAMRLYPPGPFLLPHRAPETCQVMGYTIPKDSQIIVNLWAIGRDPTIWDDPLSFKPERFLNSGLDFKGKDFEFIPFSAGRRICPGLPWAARQVPLIIANLIHLFDWVLPGNKDPAELDMNEKFPITLQMEQPLQLIPNARN